MAFAATVMFASCTNNNSAKSNEEQWIDGCYSHVDSKDTVKISLTVSENSVTGDLSYNLFEKDRNVGKIKGTVFGDTLIAEYEFRSEGMMSVREVAFLRKGKSLVEGYGPTDEEGTRFVNRKEIRFEGIELKKCD